MRTVKLSDGKTLPALGLGCYKSVGEDCYRAVRAALDVGYRHIDTASFYGNEEIVGRAIRESGIPREDITLVTKIWPTDFAEPARALAKSILRLGTYADLVLLHWPGTDENLRHRAYEALLDAREEEATCSVGVSNFLPAYLESMIACFGKGRDMPVCDQIELHAWQAQRAVRETCAKYGIAVAAWSPIMRGRFVEVPEIMRIAERHHADGAQVLLDWHLSRGRIALPKSVREERIVSNFNCELGLSEEEISAIDALDRGKGWSRDPNVYNGID